MFADEDYKQLASTGGSDKNDAPIISEVYDMNFEGEIDVFAMDLDRSASFENDCKMKELEMDFEQEKGENSFSLFEDKSYFK